MSFSVSLEVAAAGIGPHPELADGNIIVFYESVIY